MPYKSVDELPDAVKKLPESARDGWMKAYNAAYKQYEGDETKCAAVAWSAVKSMGYKKNDQGKWVKMIKHENSGLKLIDFFEQLKTNSKKVWREEDAEEEKRNTLQNALRKTSITSRESWIQFVFPDVVIVRDGEMNQWLAIEYTINDKNEVTFGDKLEVEPTYLPKTTDIKMARYIKDILYVGKFPHPQNENEIIDMTAEKLKAIADNSKKFLQAGGKIPLTVSHPKKEEDKIDGTEGFVNDVYVDDNDGKLYIKTEMQDKASQWVKDGKLQTVSPGIYHDVTTSAGKFPVLIDHVALTASPHLLAQGNFIPITASRYSGGAVFFENNAVSFDVSLWHRIKGWLEDHLIKAETDNQINLEKQKQEGDDMELKAAQDKITQLEIDNKKLQSDLDAVNVKIAEYDKKEKEALEAQSKQEKQDFEAKVDGLIKDMKVKPENKVNLMAEYEQLKSIKNMEFEGKKVSIADYLLGRFANVKSANENTVPVTGLQLRVEKELFDLNTIEGKDKLYELSMERACKIAAEKNIDNPKEVYEMARRLVLDEYLAK